MVEAPTPKAGDHPAVELRGAAQKQRRERPPHIPVEPGAERSRGRQAGMTLIVGLIILIMISLAVVASYQMSKGSMQVVSNMQFANEAVSGAHSGVPAKKSSCGATMRSASES